MRDTIFSDNNEIAKLRERIDQVLGDISTIEKNYMSLESVVLPTMNFRNFLESANQAMKRGELKPELSGRFNVDPEVMTRTLVKLMMLLQDYMTILINARDCSLTLEGHRREPESVRIRNKVEKIVSSLTSSENPLPPEQGKEQLRAVLKDVLIWRTLAKIKEPRIQLIDGALKQLDHLMGREASMDMSAIMAELDRITSCVKTAKDELAKVVKADEIGIARKDLIKIDGDRACDFGRDPEFEDTEVRSLQLSHQQKEHAFSAVMRDLPGQKEARSFVAGR